MMDITTASVEMLAPELAAAWTALPDPADGDSRAEAVLGLSRFIASEEYVQLGRRLLKERAERGSSDLAFAQIELGLGIARSASTIMSLHRDGSVHLNRLVFVAGEAFAVWTTVAAGFRLEVGTLARFGFALEESLQDLHVDDRLFLTSDFSGEPDSGVAWSGGRARVLRDESWSDAGELDIARVPDWFYASGYLMAKK